ncbi:methyltransferase [Naumannella sp. ID2617S]|nr:methyltransferase [Naumannella sp. ID2617S]
MRETAVRLADRFRELDYTVDAVLSRIGPAGQAGLGRNSTVAADRALVGADDGLAALIRLFLLQQEIPVRAARQVFGGVLENLYERDFLASIGESCRARVDLRPYASTDDGASGWVVSDLANGLDSIAGPQHGAYVLGISPASTSLAQLAIREPVRSALDLGAGCGVQSLHLARHSERVVATDLNPRANRLAEWTFALSGVAVEQRLGSLWEPVVGERFDLIVTNPPYVMSPPSGERLVYREGSMPGDGLVETIVRGAVDHLTPGGSLQVLGNWAILDPDHWADRLQGWIPAGCDALVIERERLDPFEYAEIWLADAGLLGRADYLPRYREWLDYFDRLGITGVGMGWLQVTNSGSADPQVRIESWPHAVEQPVGSALGQFREAAAYARLGDDEVLATNWRLAEGIDQETIGVPGAPDPRHVVLRSTRGLRRAVEVDTALGGVLGACDGDLPLDTIIDAVAGLLEADATSLRREVLARVRELLITGMLIR